jgi:hypothetical protein
MGHRWASPTLIVLSFACFGILEGLNSGNGAAGGSLGLLHMRVIALLLFWWVSGDSRQRGASLSTPMIVCLAAFGFMAMPFYLAGARPRNLWYAWLLKGILVLALCLAAYIGFFQLASGAQHGV